MRMFEENWWKSVQTPEFAYYSYNKCANTNPSNVIHYTKRFRAHPLPTVKSILCTVYDNIMFNISIQYYYRTYIGLIVVHAV